MKNENQFKTDNVFHERVNKLKDEGYRGFSVAGGKNKAEGFMVSAKNSKGIELKAEGDTLDEAYANLIEHIDYALDDSK